MTYFLIAGEASGDMHGARLIEAIKQQDADAQFVGLGGDLMEQQGMILLRHYRHMAFMGFLAVLSHLPEVLRNIRMTQQALLQTKPDVLILIDYPSFNLRMAKFAKQHLATKVCYYISPKLWAWKSYRIQTIRRYVDRMYTIFPFETDYYAKRDYKVSYVGNPTQETVDAFLQTTWDEQTFRLTHHLDERPIVALLAGSRRQEIVACLPLMLRVAQQFPQMQVVVAAAPGVDTSLYTSLAPKVPILFNATYPLLRCAKVAVVNSGTATLETALIGVPQVVVYHVFGGRLAYGLKECFIHTKYVSLVNIIAQREVVRELIAHLFTEENLHRELNRLIADEEYRLEILKGYAELRQMLGQESAANNAAHAICNFLHHK